MKLLVVGGYGVGLSFYTQRAPTAGETVSGARLEEHHGGKASNQAVAAARLGAHVSLFSAVGEDERAKLARTLWHEEGINADGVISIPGNTMVGCIITEASGENRIVLANGVLDDLTPALLQDRAAAFEEADIVLISCEIPEDTIRAAIRLGREANCRVILNPAPAPQLTEADWANLDLITPNYTEACQLLGVGEAADTAEDIASQLAQRHHVDVILTDGARGAVVVSKDSPCKAHRVDPIVPQQIVDTTGAGDTFNAGVAAALLYGHDLTFASSFGCLVGSVAVESEGVIPALPTAQLIKNRFNITL
ncbi:ribokinase [Corynebacterium sp. H128]|uniref:ribokinase n=1 Tax=Corynebacterium sp. H128 TaxID=3133427 RepID=UPI0030B366A6